MPPKKTKNKTVTLSLQYFIFNINVMKEKKKRPILHIDLLFLEFMPEIIVTEVTITIIKFILPDTEFFSKSIILFIHT